LYDYGMVAVALFWMISGFVFTTVYLDQKPTARAFVVTRFARLYPLHFATLVIVAVLQAISVQALGTSHVLEHNDAWHFLLNLLFISNWGFEAGYSFNGPIWSVSVEIFIYILFFLGLGLINRFRWIAVTLAAVVSLALLLMGAPLWFSACGLGFFLGSAMCFLHRRLARMPGPTLVAALAVGILGLVAVGLTPGYYEKLVPLIISFCAVIVAAAAADQIDDLGIARRFRLIGDMTYSIYLCHLPLQIAVLLVMTAFGLDKPAIASTGAFFFGFNALVFVVSWASYRYFERPARDYFRRFASSPVAASSVATASPSAK
ncbi:MAG: acyltransferase, partial [Cucumibacter sp.]